MSETFNEILLQKTQKYYHLVMGQKQKYGKNIIVTDVLIMKMKVKMRKKQNVNLLTTLI